MKTMGKMWIVMASITFLGWMTACAGTSGMMDDKMDPVAKEMMDDRMDAREGATTDDRSMMDKPMMPARQAMLKGSDGHHAAGTVSFGKGMKNQPVLTLSNLKVDKVPDGYVYLTKDADRMHGVAVGKLKQFSGNVSFDLPADLNPEDYDSVVIWCKKYNVEIGRAYFQAKTM